MLEAQAISFGFGGGAPPIENVSLAVAPGEIVGFTGPSGRGKSTLARILCGHIAPQSGRILVDGAPAPKSGFHPVQLLSQTPILAVNPRWTVGRIIREAFEPDAMTLAALGVMPEWLARYPHELSGGQLQRVSILRALAPPLRYLVADEITAMLDPLAQAEIWSVLARLAEERAIGILAISHDEALLARVASRTITLD